MALRTVKQLIKAVPVTEGAGVTVHRTIGTPALRNLDPFLMLDHFSSDDPDDYIAGFPDHPHRGFITFTYMLDGHMLHKDSMGNQGDLQSGDAQWMKAGSGVIHSEMPKQIAGLMRGFQLWINLPADRKMSEPGYQEYSSSAFPVYEADGVRVKVLIGQYADAVSPVDDPETRVVYFDVTLESNKQFSYDMDAEYAGFIYVFEGQASLSGTVLPQHSLSVLDSGEQLQLTAGEAGARFILVAGRPINESVVQYGPFVMNTQEEIHTAMRDYHEGKLVQKKASFVSD